MDIFTSLSLLALALELTLASYCNKQLLYHEQYGYGTDIVCDNLTTTDKKLMDLASYHPTYLQIRNANISDVRQDLFEDVKQLKILEIVNSTILFNSTLDIFKDLRHLKQLIIHHSMVGRISDKSFEDLGSLEHLRLSNISINILPTNCLKQLGSLISLDLSNNTFTNVNSIPLCEIPQLKELDLEGNHIDSLELSRFVCEAAEDSLGFDVNKFKYQISIPQPLLYENTVSKSQLTTLVLSHNKISQLSYSLGDLIKLKAIDLEDNKIQRIHGYELNSLVKLETINLKYNLLVNISEAVFLKNKAIKTINLANNRLINVIIRNLPVLSYINLAVNNIDINSIVKWKSLPMLKDLDLSYNNIKSLPNNVFIGITNVTNLNLSANLITLDNNTFKYLSRLKTLSLSHNNLSEIPVEVFKGLTKLETLDLSKNALKTLNNGLVFEDQLNLENLNLSYNKLESLNKKTFKPLRNLMVLDIENNNLKQIDLDIISNLRYLRTINIRNNHFSCEFLTDLLKYMKKKQIIYSHEKYDKSVLAENVGGVPCTESIKPVPASVKPIAPKNVTQISKLVSSEPTAPPPTSPVSAIIGVTVSLVLVFGLLAFLGYRYYRRKVGLNDHFELIGE